MKNRIRKIVAVLLTFMLMGADVGTIAESVIHTLTLPKALQIIEEEAFYGIPPSERLSYRRERLKSAARRSQTAR